MTTVHVYLCMEKIQSHLLDQDQDQEVSEIVIVNNDNEYLVT